jgi:hypothetical protein
MPSPRDLLNYMRTVSRGSPVDRRWSVVGMIVSQIREGNAPPDSPLTLADVMASDDYRNLMTAKVVAGDVAPDFDLAGIDDTRNRVRLSTLSAAQPVVLVFGSYT